MSASVLQTQTATLGNTNPGITTVTMSAYTSGSRLVMWIMTRGALTSVARSGWTFLSVLPVMTTEPSRSVAAGWIASAGESTSLVFTNVGGTSGRIAVVEVSGAGDPIQHVSNAVLNGSQTRTIPISGVLAHSMLVGGLCIRTGDVGGQSDTPGSGWTEDLDAEAGGAGLSPRMWIAHQLATTAGAYTFTCTDTDTFAAFEAGSDGYLFEFPVAQEPGVWIDFDKDGFTDGTAGTEDGFLARMFPEGGSTTSDNITSDVISIDIDQGQTAQVTGGSGTDTATITVQNTDRKYTPDYASSPIYGKLKPGLPVWIGVNADGTLSGSGTIYGLFAGKLREIAPIPVGGADSPTAELICDGILLDYRTPVRMADSLTRSQYSYRVAVLDAINESATRRDLAVEPDTLPLSSADSTDALSVLDALNAANGTRHFIAADANKDTWYKYTSRNRQYKLGAAADASIDAGSDHLTSISGWRYNNDGIINHQKASIDPVNFPFAIEQVWTYDNVPFTLVGANKTIWADFDDYVRDPILTVTSSGAVTSSLTPFGHSAKIDLFAASATITKIKITGQKVIREQGVSLTADDLASQASVGVRAGTDLSGDLIGASASAQGIVDHLVYRYGSRALKRPEIETHNWLPYAFSLRPYDQIGVTVDAVSAAAMKFEIVGRKLHCDVAASASLVDWVASFTLAESRIQGEVVWFTLDTSTLGGPDLLGY